MRIGAYVVAKQAKQAYASESYNVRGWPGFEMVLHSARRGGYEIDYASEATAHNYDIILVSVTSDCDWWPFIAERVRWGKSGARVIVGGAGVLNIRPFLRLVDVFVFGRGENIICDLLHAEQMSEEIDSDHIAYSRTFALGKQYRFAQADGLYPHTVALASGKPFKESAVGCPNKCLFCGYTWQRGYIGDGTFASGHRDESTMADMLRLPPETWKASMVGLDGTSERLRQRVNKRISKGMFRRFLRGLTETPKPYQLKIYNIVGYPTETRDDWDEYLEDIRAVDNRLPAGKQWSLLSHFTPFRPMPATPAAAWPMSYTNYRGQISKYLKHGRAYPGNVFFQGNALWAVESLGTDSLPTVILSALVLRGVEGDEDVIQRLAQTRKFWLSRTSKKISTLEAYVDCGRLFKGYGEDELPTRYLSYVKGRG